MILALLEVVLPVFMVIGAGYAATRTQLFAQSGVDGLMVFTQNFAIPCLLFVAVLGIDLGAAFDIGLMVSFYAGATLSFVLGIVGARLFFGRRPGEAVAVGFIALFSNSVLLGLPITERAYGTEALAPNYAIVALHAPFCYTLGITLMEVLRADGRPALTTAALVARSVIRNNLMIGILLGLAANLAGLAPPALVMEAISLLGSAALPAALFGLGGILTRYRLRESLGEVGLVGVLSLVVHPAATYALARWGFDLSDGYLRSAVVTAAMAPGVNTYIFASMYGRGQNVASASVLLLTIFSIGSVTFWLSVLP